MSSENFTEDFNGTSTAIAATNSHVGTLVAATQTAAATISSR